MLNVDQLANGLGISFNTKSQDERAWANRLAENIHAYTTTIFPPSTGVAAGKAPFIATFLKESNTLQSYLPRALTTALPIYANTIALGMQPAFTGVPPTAPLPNFQGILNSNRDGELTEDQCANALANAIHNWLATGTATNNASGVTTTWAMPGTAVIGAGPPVPDMRLSPEELAAHQDLVNSMEVEVTDDVEDEDLEISIEEKQKHEAMVAEGEEFSRPVDYSNKEFKQLQNEQNPNYKQAGKLGEQIVKEAYKYLGIRETAAGNYGGKYVAPTQKQINEYYYNGDRNGKMPSKRVDEAASDPGEIDQMLADIGVRANYPYPRAGFRKPQKKPRTNYGNPLDKRGRKTGAGDAWCGAFVTRVWNDAGACHPLHYSRNDRKQPEKARTRKPGVEGGGKFAKDGEGWSPGRCTSWTDWAKYHGIWVHNDHTKNVTPSQGWAVIWHNEKRECHIGIVAGVRKDHMIVTIEGNTGGVEKMQNIPIGDVISETETYKAGGTDIEGQGVYLKVANPLKVADRFISGYIKCLPTGAFPDDKGSSGPADKFPESTPKTNKASS